MVRMGGVHLENTFLLLSLCVFTLITHTHTKSAFSSFIQVRQLPCKIWWNWTKCYLGMMVLVLSEESAFFLGLWAQAAASAAILSKAQGFMYRRLWILTTDIQQSLVLGKLCIMEQLLSRFSWLLTCYLECSRAKVTCQELMGREEKQVSKGNLVLPKLCMWVYFIYKLWYTVILSLSKP